MFSPQSIFEMLANYRILLNPGFVVSAQAETQEKQKQVKHRIKHLLYIKAPAWHPINPY
jgi:hypothetical protein